jgi:hypothetical protein
LSIKDFEMFHGAVLTKLVRSDNPITLRMIETNLKEAWSAYTLNDEVILYIKYSTKPQQRKKNEDVLIWIFSFSTAHLGELQNLRKRKAVYMALVCGQRAIDDPNMYVCLITPDEIAQCIDIQAIQQQTINVRYEPRKKLRVWGGVNTVENPILVASRKLEDWNVPGN